VSRQHLPESSQKVRHKNNQQDRAQANARSSTNTVATMAVESAAASKHKDKNNNQNQHGLYEALWWPFIVAGIMPLGEEMGGEQAILPTYFRLNTPDALFKKNPT
jgi:hypothetical protein